MIIETAQRIAQVKEYYFSAKLREIANMNKQNLNVINLGIGSPDLPPHKKVVERLASESLKMNTHGYAGYKGIPELRQAFSNWYRSYFNVELNSETEILPLMGSKEGVMHISMSFLNPGDKALIPNPGYPTYKSATLLAGGEAVSYDLLEENNWYPDIEKLERMDLTNVKLMWLNYPHMPTGTPANKEVFEELVNFAKRHNIVLCHDNPYSFILPNENKKEYLSIFNIEGAKEVSIELNSLSKSHNMAGWRIGMMAAKSELIENVLKFKSNMDSGMFIPSQLAAVEALELPKDWYDEINIEYAKRREKAREIADLLKCEYSLEQEGMFLWAKIPSTEKDSYNLCDTILYKSHVFITPGGIFGENGEKYIRISLCSTLEVFDEAIQRIKKSIL